MGSYLIWTTVSENFISKKSAASVLGSTDPLGQPTHFARIVLSMKVFFSMYFKYHFKLTVFFLSEYLKIKKNITDEGSAQHVYEVTGCKMGCTMPKYSATIREKIRYNNVSSISEDQVLLTMFTSHIFNCLTILITLHTQFVLHFYYPSGDFTVVEQYYVYDSSAFIADFGGYLVKET